MGDKQNKIKIMATRADFYVMKDGELELIGCTSNEYSGDFEEATNLKDYLKSVRELLRLNKSSEGKWYWPWSNSHITDEVFVFQVKPNFFSKNAGVLLSKVHVNGCPETHLYFAKYDDRYNEDFNEETGEYNPVKAICLKLPIYK